MRWLQQTPAPVGGVDRYAYYIPHYTRLILSGPYIQVAAIFYFPLKRKATHSQHFPNNNTNSSGGGGGTNNIPIERERREKSNSKFTNIWWTKMMNFQ